MQKCHGLPLTCTLVSIPPDSGSSLISASPGAAKTRLGSKAIAIRGRTKTNNKKSASLLKYLCLSLSLWLLKVKEHEAGETYLSSWVLLVIVVRMVRQNPSPSKGGVR